MVPARTFAALSGAPSLPSKSATVMSLDAERTFESSGEYRTYGEMRGDMGRYGEIRGDMGRYGEAWGDMRRCGEIWGDMGRYREI